MSNWHVGQRSQSGIILRVWAAIALIVLSGLALPAAGTRAAGPILVGCGDVAGLIGAVAQANASPGPDTISLAASCIYTLSTAHNTTGGANGLPVVAGELTIQGNGATIARGADTPAFRILKNTGTLTLDGLTLLNGLAVGGNGGAIDNAGHLTLRSSAVIGSVARGASKNGRSNRSDGGLGGAIYNAGRLTLSASTLANNQAVGGDGADDDKTLGGSGFGGAIFSVSTSQITIINSTLSGNQALGGPYEDTDNDGDHYNGAGGAIFAVSTTTTISSSTIYANFSQGRERGHGLGGGVFIKGGSLSYRNSIMLGNGPSDCAVSIGVLTSLGANMLAAASGCPSSASDVVLTTQSPGILPLADNGGPTPTHALETGSPAIDAAASAGCPATDQRGVPRPQGEGCDIGAYEYQPPSAGEVYTVTTTADGDSVAGSLRQAIIDSNEHPGFDTIGFALPAGPQTITLAAPLPAITDPVVIDGTSQPGFVDASQITIDGSAAGATSGLRISADGSTLRGLTLTGFTGAGIEVAGSDNLISENIVYRNGGAGIAGISGSGNSLHRNLSSENGGLGIDLAPGVNADQPFPTIASASERASDTLIAGTLATPTSASFSIDLFGNIGCDPSGNGEAQIYLGTVTVAGSAGSMVSWSQSLARTDLSGFWITALATDAAGNSSELAACVPVTVNNLWTNALPLNLQPTNNSQIPGEVGATVSQKITSPFQERWYRFPVTPGSRIAVTLDGASGSAISLHRDLPTVYRDLNSPAGAEATSANNLPGSYLPGSYLPGSYLPGSYLPGSYLPGSYLPGSYLPGSYLPGSYLPGSYLPGSYLPGSYLPGSYLPGSYLPGSYLPGSYLPGSYLPQIDGVDADPQLYVGAIFNSLIAIGADPAVTIQSIQRNSWDQNERSDQGFYVRVVGPVDLDQSFSLKVTVEPGACVNLSSPPGSLSPIVGGPPGNSGLGSLIVWDSQRFAQANPNNSAGQVSALGTALANFAARSDIHGTLVDLASQTTYPRVAYARAQLQANPDCSAAANLVAREIKSVIDVYRDANQGGGQTTLQYLVLVGGDDNIPFFRYPDLAGLGNENEYFPPVEANTPADTSLRDGRVSGQDEYGAATTIWRGSYALPLPDIAVGRLVGDAAAVSSMLAAYTSTDGMITPRSALVTGYDFVADGAAAVSEDLADGLNTTPRELIQPGGEPPTGLNAWSADDLRQQLFNQRSDMVLFTGHFAAGSLLAADYQTGLLAEEVTTAPASFTNSLIFALGCHSGYNVPPPDAIANASPHPDWPEAFAARGATYIGATGYAYGDTELIEYGERYLLSLTRELRTGSGPVTIGAALMRARQDYLAQKPSLSGMDEKTVLEFTLYGLPMMQVNMPGTRLDDTSSSIVGGTTAVAPGSPGAGFSLAVGSPDININSTLTGITRTLTNIAGGTLEATYYTGSSGAVANPAEPILPLELRDVGVAGKALRGVAFRSGSYSDLADIIPLTTAPATESSRGFAAFYDQNFYPAKPWNFNTIGTFSGGSPHLAAIVGQYRSNGPHTNDGTLRLFSSMSFRTYYLDLNWAQSATTRAAGVAPAPQIRSVTSERLSPTAVLVRVFISEAVPVGVQEAWLTYTDQAAPGTWQSIDLAPVPGEPGFWEVTSNLPETAVFMVQVVGAAGQVGLDTNNGAFYGVAPLTPPPPPPAPVATTLSGLGLPSAGTFGQAASFSARLTDQGSNQLGGRLLQLTIGLQSAFALTDDSGVATFNLTLSQLPGSYTAQIRYAGEPGYAATNLASPFVVQKAATSLVISPTGPVAASSSDTGIKATLTSAGTPVADRTVIFIATGASGNFAQAVKTGQDGQAVLGAISWPVGSYSVRAYFVGTVPLPSGSVTLTDLFYSSSTSESIDLTLAPLPETTITAGPSGATSDTVAIFSFTGSGGTGQLRFECSLDGAAFTGCTSPIHYSGLENGQHTFLVRAVDAADQADPTPAARSWSVGAIYRARVVDGSIWVERDIVAADLGDYDTPPTDGWALVGRTSKPGDSGILRDFYVEDGVPYIVVFNSSRSRGDRCILETPTSLDTVKRNDKRTMTIVEDPFPCPPMPPDTRIEGGYRGEVAARRATFNFKAFNGVGPFTFECSLDGAPFAPCSAPIRYRDLAVGPHTFQVRAVDANGLADTTPATRSWTVKQR